VFAAMPPKEYCPICRVMVHDWHVEWYETERPALYQGLAAMDCPVCGQPVGFQKNTISPAPFGVPVARRSVAKAAEWAALGAQHVGGTLHGYVSTLGAGAQYANYWTAREVQDADANEKAKQQGP
jgi:hypothetical protein